MVRNIKKSWRNRPNRVRQLWSTAVCNDVNTISKIIPSQTVDIEGLKSLFSLGRTAKYQLTGDPSFPKTYVITARHYLWNLAEVEAWFVSRKGKRAQTRNNVAINPRDEVIDGIRFVKKVA